MQYILHLKTPTPDVYCVKRPYRYFPVSRNCPGARSPQSGDKDEASWVVEATEVWP
jgi:hypothetical protein